MSIPTAPPSGFRDFLPADCSARSRAVEAISRVYRSFGFSQIATSAVEDLAVLLGKGGGDNEKLIFKIMKRGEKVDVQDILTQNLDLLTKTTLSGDEVRRILELINQHIRGGALCDSGLRFDLTLPL